MMTLHTLRVTVIATNKMLREAVNEMNPIILLRNVHPTYRGDFASRLYHEEVITKDEAHEFVRIVK